MYQTGYHATGYYATDYYLGQEQQETQLAGGYPSIVDILREDEEILGIIQAFLHMRGEK